jgi:hypothetical protein
MENLPIYIALLFGLTTAVTIFIFYKATGRSSKVLFILLGWLLLQTIVSLSGFYTNTDVLPPRFLLLVIPPFLLIASLFIFKKGRRFIDSLDIKLLTLLHIIRVPVELVLLFLLINKAIPKIMTFEGQNFDILSGLLSPVVYYFVFVKNKWGKPVLLAWNFICLALLINIVTIAVLTLPYPLQQLAFDQPNRAVLYFPFVLLPGVVVPLVLFSHLASIRLLVSSRQRRDREKHLLSFTQYSQ